MLNVKIHDVMEYYTESLILSKLTLGLEYIYDYNNAKTLTS